MSDARVIFLQLVRYGITTAASYVALLGGTYLLHGVVGLPALWAYAISLTIVYIGVFLSYAHFVFKTGTTASITRRFVIFLCTFWFVNNGFFWLLHDVAGIPYPVVIVLNLFILGGVRFFIQRQYVFQVVAPAVPRAALSFDVELWHEGRWLQRFITGVPGDGGLRESVEALMRILAAHGAHATFFCTKLIVERYPELVRELARAGHEIGVHGVAHERLHEVDPARFRAELAALCVRIEALTGARPRGFRAPHFSLDDTTRWLLPLLAELGFRYDSSIFPMRTPEYGVAAAPQEPYRISFDAVARADERSPLLEVPLAAARLCGMRLPAAGGIYFRLLPLAFFSWLVRRVPGTPVLYFHPHELYAATPRVRGPFLKTTLKYWGTRRAMRKFERLCARCAFDSIEHAVAHAFVRSS